jgi:MFS family permease
MGSYPFKNYMYVTGAYWVFTLTDGALRMLVLLHFYTMGYDAFQIALLFLLYEVAGVFTNLIGGWIGAYFGLRIILYVGLGLQVIALSALANFDPSWPTWQAVVFVMGLQALSGIAKDLTKLSAKSIVKIVSPDAGEGALFKWVAILTGSKNALKGIGFFLGGVLLAWVGYAPALFGMAAAVALALGGVLVFLTADIGKAKEEIKFLSIFSKTPAIKILSAARLFLFGARDIWFVVGLPFFLAEKLNWSHTEIGSYMAIWIIGYGLVQSIAPKIVEGDAASARLWLLVLIFVTAVMSTSLYFDIQSALTVVIGLIIFGILFALNSSIHSFLILAYSDSDKIALNVGFYYTANAGGRLIGILLSGLTYQQGGIFMCLVTALSFLIVSWLIALSLPKMEKSTNSPD